MELELLNRESFFSNEALLEAKCAYNLNEIPVGAVVVVNSEIVGRGYNLSESKNNSLYHAEIIAITDASSNLKTKNLSNAILYTSLEPCMMCLGYIHLMKIKTVKFLAYDTKYGVCGGWQDLTLLKPFGNNLVVSQIQNKKLITESSDLISNFFTEIRDGR